MPHSTDFRLEPQAATKGIGQVSDLIILAYRYDMGMKDTDELGGSCDRVVLR